MSSLLVGVASGVGVVGCFESCGGDGGVCGDECGESGGGVPQSGWLGLLGVNLIAHLGLSRILLLFLLLPQSLCGLIPVVLVFLDSVPTVPLGYFCTFSARVVTGEVADLFLPLPWYWVPPCSAVVKVPSGFFLVSLSGSLEPRRSSFSLSIFAA